MCICRAPRRQTARIRDRAWVDDFIHQLAIFPKGEYDDDVDAFTQLMVKWQYGSSSAMNRMILEMNREDDDADSEAGEFDLDNTSSEAHIARMLRRNVGL